MEAKRVIFDKFGHPRDVLRVERRPVERPREGEILVRMKARPINPSDLIPIRGAYAHRISLPAVPGYEGVGVVVDAGPGVSREMIGRRVLPLRGEGTWQEYVAAPARYAVPIPEAVDDFTAAQLYINPLTAWVVSTETLQLTPGDVLAVNACGSSLGRIFAQLSKLLGFRLIAVTRNGSHTEDLHKLGASHVVDTATTSLYHAVMELTDGLGANAAIDSIGGPDGRALAECVRPHGTLLTLGLLSGVPVDWAEIARRTKINVKLFHLRHWNELVSVPKWHDTFLRILALINGSKLVLGQPGPCFGLQDVREAVSAAESGRAGAGKVFLVG
ncbi:zinc-dependent alcohol dehydrogenase family protein [Paenibacillus hamazuiensis]|uniref:zinc-dependent alcohol dehydrogenase family protein n=1 Tax=Paenibacillus hamazuiensis TaxID=2936508 RepID=UPI00200C9858|nr:zinc-dependent alcohol dehydrogenase family protein [Paenibacillus hamazuiensis]